MKNIEDYINKFFIDLDINRIPPSLFVVRNSILSAVKELKPMLKGDVLDLGCGVMPYKDYLNSPLINKYIGVDLKEPSSYQGLVVPDLYWDGVKIPIGDSSCDFVIATEFLEHYHETADILLEINRVLKKNGILFFTVPAIWPIHEAPNDHHRFTPYSLIQYFTKSGFSKWEIKALGGFHLSVAIILSLWFDRIRSKNRRFLLNSLFKLLIKILIKKDNKLNVLKNGELYSGLYGFVVK